MNAAVAEKIGIYISSNQPDVPRGRVRAIEIVRDHLRLHQPAIV
jgi:hypothetical protein